MTWNSIRSVSTLLCVLPALLITGCVISARTDTSYTPMRTRLSESTLSQIHPGSTTREWLIAACGAPTSQEVLPDGTQILKYEYTEKKTEDFTLIFLIHSESSKEQRNVTYFEIRDGVVARYWQEST